MRYGVYFLDTDEWFRSPSGNLWDFDFRDAKIMEKDFLANKDRDCEVRPIPHLHSPGPEAA